MSDVLRLRVARRGLEPREYTIGPADGPVFLGRDPEARVRLNDLGIARRHAVVEHDGEAFVLRDLGHAGPLRLDGAPVRERRLVDGDALRLGKFELLVRLPGTDAGEAPLPSTAARPSAESPILNGALLVASTAALLAAAATVLVR